MTTTVCVVIVAVILVGGLLLTGFHIVAGVLHFVLSIIHALFQWPLLLLILVALIAVWVIFQH